MTKKNKHPVMMVLLGTTLVPLLGACTNQELYESTRSWRIQECQDELDVKDYNQCMDGAMMSYGEYDRLRHEDPVIVQDDSGLMLPWQVQE